MQIRETSFQEDPRIRQGLEVAVELDPTFSRAWAELVSNLAFLNIFGHKPEMTRRAEQALQKLKAVAPDSADYRIAQGAYVYYALKDYDRAHDLVSQALTMNPSDVRTVELRSWIERRQGDFDAYVASGREARKLDPRNPYWTDSLLIRLLLTHRYDEAWTVLQGAPLETYRTGYTRSLLLFREDRDFHRLQESMDRLSQLYEEPDGGWDARVANRGYPGALASLDPVAVDMYYKGISANDQRRILTYWLMEEDKLLTEGLGRWQSQLDTARDDSGEFYTTESYIEAAMLAGLQGKTEESERLIQRFFRLKIDWAVRALERHRACQVLGMIAATQAAVKCIRDGLKEASLVTPFLEPYLPFYDSIRDESEFIAMLADIDPEAPATTAH